MGIYTLPWISTQEYAGKIVPQKRCRRRKDEHTRQTDRDTQRYTYINIDHPAKFVRDLHTPVAVYTQEYVRTHDREALPEEKG